MIRIKLDLAPGRKELYTAALARLRAVRPAEDGADALVTGDVSAAKDSPVPCLLDGPEECDPGQLERLSGVSVMPGHEWRFLPEILPVAECHAADQLGAPGLLRIHHWLAADLPPRRAAFAQVDLAHWFFGSPPARAHFLTRPHYLQLHLGFPGDGMALIDLATNRPGTASYYSMHLIGSEGAAYADDHRNAHLLIGGEGSRAIVHEQNLLLAIQAMVKEFVAGISGKRAWNVALQDTVHAQQTLKEVPDA